MAGKCECCRDVEAAWLSDDTDGWREVEVEGVGEYCGHLIESLVAETTSDGTKVTVNVTTPDHHDKDGTRGKRAANYAGLAKSPSGGGRRVMSRNAENISPHPHRPTELARTASGRIVSGKRVASSASAASVKEGRVRKASGSRVASNGQR